MYKKILTTTMTAVCAAVVSTGSLAFQFGKPIETPVVVTKKNDGTTKKQVTVLNIRLSQKQQNLLMNFDSKRAPVVKSVKAELPASANAGMNNVPVLDQGRHGTCVTFATTAALDAIIGKGDYISQLCNLELGSYLEGLSYIPSGWDGSWGKLVLGQIEHFGVVPKEAQFAKGYAGVMDYPTKDGESKGNPMSLVEFNKSSVDVMNDVGIYSLEHMNVMKRLSNKFQDTDAASQSLLNVKQAINNHHRVLIGTFLVLSPYCSAGACATHNAEKDTWALTNELTAPPYYMGGHEMVIYAYDDNATATDSSGNKHRGLLTLRNSWGSDVGDNGDYYMTYDYFMKFAQDVQELAPMQSMD